MKAIDTKIDNLGRILIPKKYRIALGLEADSKINLSLNDDSIIITPSENKCLICGNKDNVNFKFCLCNTCIDKIKQNE